MNARAEPLEAACDLRFGQVGIACVRLRRVDAAALVEELERRVRSAPQMFARAAVVLDLSHLPKLPDDGMVDALLEAIRSAGMLPVGIAYGTPETEALAERMNLPLIAKFRAQYEPGQAGATPGAGAPARSEPVAAMATIDQDSEPGSATTAQHHTGSAVRSGQQIYARDRDLVVTAAVANGAEVIADGSIHIYGALRGRALAGASGSDSARIFCREFNAELVAIAGTYKVLEEVPPQLVGKPVQIWLENEKLRIEEQA